MKIEFPDALPILHVMNNLLEFTCIVDGDVVTNRIPIEVLRAEFDGRRVEAVAAFERHRDQICKIATCKIEAGYTNDAGGADILFNDRDEFLP